MKKLLLFAVIAAASAGLVSCVEEEDPVKDGPKITLQTTEVEVKPEGDEVRVSYQVENAVEDVKLTAETDAGWIRDLEVKTRLFSFHVDRNDTGETRTADITLDYEGAEQQTVTVTQAAWLEPISLTVVSTEATSVTFTVNTADENLTWIGQIVGKEWYDAYKDNEEKIFEEDLYYFSTEASANGVSMQEYLSAILIKGSKENLTMAKLDPMSDYVLYVYGLNTNGEPTTGLYTAHITTAAPYDGPMTFTFDIKDNNSVMDVTVTPDHDGVKYYWTSNTPDVLKEYDEDIDKAVKKWLEARVQDYIAYGDVADRAEFHSYFSSINQTSSIVEGFVNTDYVFYAFKWDEDCNIIGDISYAYYSTGDIIPSDNVITTTVSDITQSTFYVDAQTTNLDPYFLYAEPTENLAGISTDDDYFQYFWKYGTSFIWYYMNYGDIGGTFYEMQPDTEYTLVAFGYLSGARTTPVTIQKFRTLPMCDPKDCEFDIQVSNVKVTSAEVSIKPSDTGYYYYWDVYPADYTANMMKEDIKAKFKESYGGMYDFAQYLSQAESSGYLSYLTPETEYKIGVAIIEYDPSVYEDYTIDFLGYVAFSDTFTTPEMKISTTTVTCGFDEYYSGKEIAALEPQRFGNMQDYPYMFLTLEINGDYSEYYYNIFEYQEGYEDPAQYPDPIWYDIMVEKGYSDATSGCFTGRWDTPLLIMAMAIDPSGNYSEIYRQKIYLTKDGTAPAINFVNRWDARPTAASVTSALEVASYEKPAFTAKAIRNGTAERNRFSSRIPAEARR